MQDFLNNLVSIQWWLGVVLVGLAINIVSIPLKKKLDLYFGSISNWWRNKNTKRKALFDRGVEIIKNNPDQLNLALFTEMRERVRAIHGLLVAIMAFILGISIQPLQALIEKPLTFAKYIPLVFYFLGTLSFIFSQSSFKRAMEINQQISAALKSNNNA